MSVVTVTLYEDLLVNFPVMDHQTERRYLNDEWYKSKSVEHISLFNYSRPHMS